ncbi:MAG: polysaccharide biosynthesis C-terminal domain-containing protein, partial [Providencia sp.]
QLMNLAFIGPMQHAGLALSIGIAACFNAGVLYWQLRKQDIFQPLAGWRGFIFKLLIAVVVMTGVLFAVLHFMPQWQEGNMLMRMLRLMGVVVVGAGSYFVALYALGFRPRDFKKHSIA